VYQVRGDVNHYQSLLRDAPATPAAAEMLRFHGRAKAAMWVPPPVYSPTLSLKAPDIWTLNGALVFPPEALAVLDDVLSKAGELLPLPFEGETWHVFNIVHTTNCLNEEATTWLMNGEHRVRAQKLAFHEHRLPEPTLFTVPQASVRTLCIQGLVSPEDDFKAVVEDNGLTGLEFELLWDSEAASVSA
jgi:hypothetical protein